MQCMLAISVYHYVCTRFSAMAGIIRKESLIHHTWCSGVVSKAKGNVSVTLASLLLTEY